MIIYQTAALAFTENQNSNKTSSTTDYRLHLVRGRCHSLSMTTLLLLVTVVSVVSGIWRDLTNVFISIAACQ